MQINTVVYRESVYFSALDRFLSTRSVITLQVRISIYLNNLTLNHRIYVSYYTILSESLSTLIRLLKTVEVKILAKIGRREAELLQSATVEPTDQNFTSRCPIAMYVLIYGSGALNGYESI